MHARSGDLITVGDLGAGEAAAVVSLEALDAIHIELQRIEVGPAATVGELATALEHRALFLPLPDAPSRSLVAAALSDDPTAFRRSGGAGGLAAGVVEADVVRTDDAHVGTMTTLDSAGWAAFRARPDGIVTRLVFDASTWGELGKNRWLLVWLVPYTPTRFEALCDGLFGARAPEGVDVTLRASSGAFREKVVLVRATGQDRARSMATRRFVESLLDEVGTAAPALLYGPTSCRIARSWTSLRGSWT